MVSVGCHRASLPRCLLLTDTPSATRLQFWDFEPPKSLRYWGVQRECQNAALLQMMETAVEQAVAAQRPVLVIPDPASHDDAKVNQAAFCDEGRQHQPRLPAQQQPEPSAETPAAVLGVRAITTVPRMRKCYGWLTLPRGLFDGTPSWLRPPYLTFGMKLKRFMQPGQEYPAILYEYVEYGENDPSRVQEALDFFSLAGFSATMSPLARNWKSNVLLDLGDIVHARGFGWKERYYKPRDADIVLSIGAGVPEEDYGFGGYRPPPEVVARAMALKYGPEGPPPPRPPPLRPPWAVRDRHAVMAERRRIRGISPSETAHAASAETSDSAATTELATTTELRETTEPAQSSPSSNTIPGLMPTRLRPRPDRAAADNVSSPAKRWRRSGAQGRARREYGRV